MDLSEWQRWRKHINQTVKDTGQCIILSDADGEPIMEVPPPVEMTAEDIRMNPGDLSLTVPTLTESGALHPIVDVLVDEGMGVDSRGVMNPDTEGTFLISVFRRGSRLDFLSVDRDAEGVARPHELTINGTGLLSYLSLWPCPSHPASWQPKMREWSSDEAQTYSKPRFYGPIEMATKADGYTVTGPAEETIQKLIQDSLDAGMRVQGWEDPHIVVNMTPSGLPSPVVNIRCADEPLWDTIESACLNAGVNVSMNLWWPGDEPVMARSASGDILTNWDKAVAVVTVAQNS